MTQFLEKIVKCGVCGKETNVKVMTSTSSFGSRDLDNRPPAMFPFTLFLQHCEHCGYVSKDITESHRELAELMQSDIYKTCDEIYPVSIEAKRYIQYAIIQAHKKVIATCELFEPGENTLENMFWGFLNAAWACDDKGGKKAAEDAIECRKRCLDLVNVLIVNSEKLIQKETYMQIKADLLRRTNQFDAMIAEYINKHFESIYIEQIIRFQLDLAEQNDNKRYSMDNIDPKRYPLKDRNDEF